MKVLKTSHHRTWLQFISVFMLLFVGMRASAQITTTDCTNTYSYCDADTVKLEPQDIVTYTNFQWYSMGTPDVAINAGNAATYNVDPSRLTVPGTIYVTNSGGTYILKAEYATPSGCATKNDTITINFLTVPDLVTTTDTICASASQTANLASLVVDNNAVAGTTPTWYPTLADAQAGTNALASTTVNPSATTKYYVRKNTTATDAEGTACHDIDSVIIDVRCLNLGNFIAYDTNNNGIIETGENGIADVTVNLFYDANGNGSIDPLEQTPYATVVTDVNGLYLFENLPPGNYFVGIPASEFASGGTLQYLHSSGTTINGTGVSSETAPPDPDVASTTDDNGQSIKTGFYAGGVLTNGSVTLSYTNEPTGEPDPGNLSTVADGDDNLTVGFTFYGMSLGTTIFADVNNSGTQDPGEGGIAGVTVHLYAADGTTIIATTTSDSNGNVLFTGLPQGQYIIGVDYGSPALAGQHNSDDTTTSGTPESNDGDDNGVNTVGSIVQTNVITLTPGGEPTGEPDHGTAMGDPSVTDNPLNPDSNSNLYVDFGSVPDCPTITNPTGAQTICATETGTNLTADASSTAGNIRFVRHASAQTGNAMYTGGTVIANSVAPVTGTATYTFNTADFPNTGTTVLTYYVYAIMATPSADPTCRPFQEIQVVVNPKPTATNASITECENALGSGEGDFTLTDANTTVLGGQTGMTVTYHATLAHAQAGTPDLTSGYAAPAGTIYVRVENAQGCYATATITLNVSPKPDFTLALATVCPGDEPEVNISNLLNGDVMLSTMSVNGGTFNPYDASPPSITTADGLTLGATNTITVRNEFGCETAKTIAVPNITPLVCPPVNVSVKRAGE
jgi:SdrD B-like domain